MAAGTVAGVYAQALLELADEGGRREAIVASCRDLVGDNARDQAGSALAPQVIAALDDPKLGKTRAKAALDTALSGKVAPELQNLLKLLVDRNRLGDAPAILREVIRSADQAAGRVVVDVVSAEPLSPAARERVEAGVRRAVGGAATISARVEPKLIGGMTIRVGDVYVDGSVRRQLNEMKARILDVPVGESLWVEK